MARLVVRRSVHVVAVLLLVTFAVSFMLEVSPGDPAYEILGDQASPEQVEEIHAQLGLDQPFYVRYWNWLTDAAHGDLGTSLRTGERVLDTILQRLPVTGEIVLLAVIIALAVSVPLGIYTAYRPGRWVDRLSSAGSSALLSLPVFVTGLLLVYLLALGLSESRVGFPATGWAPLSDGVWRNLWYAFLPALTLALVEIPAYIRLLRADMISTLREDFILAAWAKGIPVRQVLFRHALRPSSFSMLTFTGLSLGRLIGGAVVVEVLFALPGVGQLLVLAIQGGDMTVVQGMVVVVAFGYVLSNSLVDVAYGYLDPRVRSQGAPA